MESNDIQTGVITRIYLKNFVTYDEVTVKPGRNLNLIIGPNGTGKSTIVSGIVLGLGGNPKVLNRAPQVKDYVKHDCQEAHIEIDLQHGPNKFITVMRKFDCQNHTSWFVNNKTATMKQITDLMKNFNIQVDNLCQFLPQDRVQEFSALTPCQLLDSTQKAVGDPSLKANHEKLKELRTVNVALKSEIESKSRLLQREKEILDSLKDSVGHINEQKKIQQKLKLLKQKRAWILYQNKYEEVKQARVEKKKAESVKKETEKKLKPIQEEVGKLKNAIQNLEKTAKQHNTETSAKAAKLNKFSDDIEKYEKTVTELEKDCDQKVKDEQELDSRIDIKRQQKNKLENDLSSLLSEYGSIDSIQSQLHETTPAMNTHKSTFSHLKMIQDSGEQQLVDVTRIIHAEERNLAEVQNIENKRLQLLQRVSADAYKGVLWLRSNQHLFTKPVHEPMMLLINLKDEKYAKYFENVIPNRDLTAFVCEDKNDMNSLIRYLRDQQKLKVNVVHSDPNRDVNYHPVIPLRSIEQYGFEHYLLSLIEAPTTILKYLVQMYKLNSIPIGNERVTANIEQLPDHLNRFFTPNHSYSVNRSKYSGEKSTRQSVLSQRGNCLSVTIDTERIYEIQNKIALQSERRNALVLEIDSNKEKIREVEKKISEIKEIRSRLQNNINNIRTLEVRINTCQQQINDSEKNRTSVDEIRSNYKNQIKEIILRQISTYKQYNKMLDDCYKNIIINEEMKLQIKLKKNTLATKENDSHDLRQECENAERNYRTLDNELKTLMAEATELHSRAKDLSDGIDSSDPGFAKLKENFAKLPPTVEELLTEIQATQAKIFCINNDQEESQRILNKYKSAKTNVENLNKLLEQKHEELQNNTEQIEIVKKEWLPLLNSLVEKINNNFSNYFTKMKCAGEVSLSTGEDKLDFDKYGLQIKVKFRDADELQVLTRNHQSGGERAVTTAVYMIALQELTRVPFRCVDEINQGMDATNERRVFELIVDITSKSTSSQYFMLTPKLLPDLKYNESVSVLVVFNGKYMIPSSKLDLHENCDHIVEVVRRRQRASK